MKQQSSHPSYSEKMSLLRQVVKPDLFCIDNNQVKRVCLNPTCTTALMCDKEECKSCGIEVHSVCSSISLTVLTSLINRPLNEFMKFINSTSQIENNIVHQLQQNRNRLAEQYPLGRLNSKHHTIISKVYEQKNSEAFNGKQAKQLYGILKNQFQKDNKEVITLYEKYSEVIRELTKQLLQVQELAYQEYISGRCINSKLSQISRKLKGQKQNIAGEVILKEQNDEESQPRGQIKISSNIMASLKEEQINYLYSALNYPVDMKLIFRASEHSFSALAFHQKCDNIPDTLTIVRTEFGKTVAGFSHYIWNKPTRKDKYVDDEERKTFLLQLDLQQKLVPMQDTNLITVKPGYGPYFGGEGGNDLRIVDRCNTNRNSQANFPTSYNLDGANKYVKNDESKKILGGQFEFQVLQYEVFRVFYK